MCTQYSSSALVEGFGTAYSCFGAVVEINRDAPHQQQGDYSRQGDSSSRMKREPGKVN